MQLAFRGEMVVQGLALPGKVMQVVLALRHGMVVVVAAQVVAAEMDLGKLVAQAESVFNIQFLVLQLITVVVVVVVVKAALEHLTAEQVV
jgi:ABC-type nitrate/sulfonate/bicarbonate transport system permease component